MDVECHVEGLATLFDIEISSTTYIKGDVELIHGLNFPRQTGGFALER